MPYYPITGSATQYQKSNGNFAQNYYLKFYASGTTTSISSAPNASATDDNSQPQFLDKVKINERGYPVNPSGGEIIPHLDQAYKIVLYKNAADANADNTGAAEWVIDNLSPGLIGFSLTQNDQDATEIDYIADNTASTRKIDTRLQERMSLLDFAADPTGVVDADTAIATALLAAKDIYVPTGTYLTTGFKILQDNQNVHFGANVILKAAENDSKMFWQTSSGCTHTGSYTVDSNSKSGVWGQLIGPADLTSTVVLDSQIGNILPGVEQSGGEEVLVLQSGPEVSGSTSLCGNNFVPLVKSSNTTRLVYFRPPTNANALLSSNNVIRHVVASGSSINTAVDIESGSHNTIHSLECNGLAANGSPNSTATGLKVDDSCPVTGNSNRYNCIISGGFESCNRDIDNGNSTTVLLAVDYSYSNSNWSSPALHNPTSTENIKLYTGKFNSTGVSLHSPPNWTPSQTGSGAYRVTHNLGTTNYTVTVSSASSNINAEPVNITSSYFEVSTKRHNSDDTQSTECHYQVMAY